MFAPKREPHLVDVPKLRHLTIDDEGSPEGASFYEAIEAFYSTAYAIKFRLEKAGYDDCVVPPLEALWVGDDEPALDENRRDG